MSAEDIMRTALEEAKKGDMPYGAAIAKNGEIVATAYNTVKTDSDPSAHAEINVIRLLTAKIGTPSLEGYTLYATCEPCPMCATACVWSGVSEIIIGASIKDLIEIGISQINISCEEVIAKGPKEIKVTKGLLREESLSLFQQ